MPPRRCLPRAIAAALLAAVPLMAVAHEADPPPPGSSGQALSAAPQLSVIGPAPEFALPDVHGDSLRLSDLRGRVVLLAFIYTSCPSACPLLTYRMARLQDALRKAQVFPHRVRMLSVTIDPVTDTRDVLAGYAKQFHADARGWHFLRDEKPRLDPVLAAYHEWTRPLANGEMDHPARLYLIDAQGRIREIYSLSFFNDRQAYLDILALLRESS